jgi:RHS repeat-associated protein
MKLFNRNNGYLPQHLYRKSWRLKMSAVSLVVGMTATLIPVSAVSIVDDIKPAAAATGTGEIDTAVGNGTAGYSGDGGPATSAELNNPLQVTFDSAGNAYIADAGNNRIRKVNKSTGIITTIAGDGIAGFSGDGGPATSAELNIPTDVALDGVGNLYIADRYNQRIRKVDLSTGVITTVAGTGTAGFSGDGGLATAAELNEPYGVVIDHLGNLYIADSANARVRKVLANTGNISTYAGSGCIACGNNDVPSTQFDVGIAPEHLALDSAGNLYIVSGGQGQVYVVWADSGYIHAIAGQGVFEGSPATYGGELDGTNFYPGSTINDGAPAVDAENYLPDGVAVNGEGDIFFSDSGLNKIREVTKSQGHIHTVVGTSKVNVLSDPAGYSGDGGPAKSAELSNPWGVTVGNDGNLYVADADNNRIRVVYGIANTGPVDPVIEPSSTLGGGNSSTDVQQCNLTATPVDCATGDFWHTFNDLSIPGRGVPLSLSRTYNSLSAASDSPFGHGWSWNYGLSVNYDPSTNTATVNQEDGAEDTFTDDGSGNFTPPSYVFAKLVHNGDGTWTFTRRATQIFDFNSAGQLIDEKDLNGYATSISYPDSSHIVVTDPANRTLTFALDGAGHITSVTDPINRTESFTYDGSGNLNDAVDVGGGHWQFTYDSNHLLLTMRSPRFYGDTNTSPSPIVTNVYDSHGRVTSQTDQLGRTTTFSYDDSLTTTTVTDPKGNVEVEQYIDGELVALTKGYGTSNAAVTGYTYDPNSAAVASITDPNNHTTTYSYDSNGNQTGESDALGHSTSATYNALNDPTSLTDADGNTTTFNYDADGNLLAKTQVLNTGGGSENETTAYAYGDASHPGDVTKVTDPSGKSTSVIYDAYGDVASSTDPDGNQTRFNYNGPVSIGWVSSQVSPKGNTPGGNSGFYTTTYTRDGFGRILTTKDPDWNASNPSAHMSTNVYDADGNMTSTTNGNGRTTSYYYDPAGQLIKTTNPDGTSQQTSYYGDGSIHTQTDGNGHATSYAYDPLGNLSSVTNPSSQTTSYTYDGAGNVVNEVNPGGSCSGSQSGCITYSYDAGNRMTGITYSDGTHNVVNQYDNDGNKIQMTDGTGNSYWSYDSLNRLVSQSDGSGATVAYGYNRNNQVTSITYPGNLTVNRTYDDAGKMTSVNDWLGNSDKFTYDPNSNQTSTKYGNDLTDVNAYDNANQLTNINVGKGLATFNYTRSGNGSLTGATGSGAISSNESLNYDQNNQLSAYNGQSLSYDNAGNLTTTDTGSTISYNNANEITGVTTAGVTTPYGYDPEGARISVGSSNYSYNDVNEMTAFSNGSTSASYEYSGDGERVQKTVNGTTNHFVYDDVSGNSLILSDGTNDYIYGPNGMPIEQINGSNVTYMHQDQLGSTRLLTDQNRNVVGTYSYDAYGKTSSHTGSASTPIEYAGQYLDAESSLYWMRARYYDPTTGSFTTIDPLIALTNAAYGYAADNPANATDPSGEAYHYSKNSLTSEDLSGWSCDDLAQYIQELTQELQSRDQDLITNKENFQPDDGDYKRHLTYYANVQSLLNRVMDAYFDKGCDILPDYAITDAETAASKEPAYLGPHRHVSFWDSLGQVFVPSDPNQDIEGPPKGWNLPPEILFDQFFTNPFTTEAPIEAPIEI